MKDIEKKLENLYTKLGKAYYEGRFEDPLPELLPLFDAITELKCHLTYRCCNSVSVQRIGRNNLATVDIFCKFCILIF